VVAPAAGAVVLVRFPFSDLSQTKLRPAVVLVDVGRGDCILCQITSKPYGDASAIELDNASFVSGSLRVTSYARPAKLFTANQNLITSQVGTLKPAALRSIAQVVTGILHAGKLP
jgi:mRNA interferase MazF